jgi:hypothetical protein
MRLLSKAPVVIEATVETINESTAMMIGYNTGAGPVRAFIRIIVARIKLPHQRPELRRRELFPGTSTLQKPVS